MVMPGPRLALDRRAVPAARSPGQRPLCEVWARLCHPGPSSRLPTVRHPQKSTPHSCVGTRPPWGSSDPAAGSPSGSRGVSCIRPALGETHKKPARSRRLSLLPSTMRGDTCRFPHLPPAPRDAPNPEGCKLSAAWAFGLSAWVSTGHPLRVTATGHPCPPSEDWREVGADMGLHLPPPCGAGEVLSPMPASSGGFMACSRLRFTVHADKTPGGRLGGAVGFHSGPCPRCMETLVSRTE